MIFYSFGLKAEGVATEIDCFLTVYFWKVKSGSEMC